MIKEVSRKGNGKRERERKKVRNITPARHVFKHLRNRVRGQIEHCAVGKSIGTVVSFVCVFFFK